MSFKLGCLCGNCYLSTAAAETLAVWAARCSGLALCWGLELQKQAKAAPLVGPPGQSALKQLGRSSSLHLRRRKEGHYSLLWNIILNRKVYWNCQKWAPFVGAKKCLPHQPIHSLIFCWRKGYMSQTILIIGHKYRSLIVCGMHLFFVH